MYQVRFRYYHPTLGTWTARDSEYFDGLNLYEYAKSQPSRLRDPSGLLVSEFVKAVKRFFG